ncbi:MAG TPA: AMP-binding protein [Acidimicrobiales bacterium]|jgi:acyl-CoA synthetase (AMP-forming)/AMP-acid ligase II|nr:AMP-binding protein [Acidimicrobiales bacterium]
MTKWNFADVWETVAETLPEAPALTQGSRTQSWKDTDRRADNVARWLLGAGVAKQDKVALYLYNCPEYLEATFAIFKVGLVPINTNYRYADNELAYLWENADAVAVVFHGVFTERIEGVRDRVPGIRSWLWVDDGTSPCPSWAVAYDSVAADDASGDGAGDAGERTRAPWGRSPDDLNLLYTGGTTGMPKGVMWRQDDLFALLNGSGFRQYGEEAGVEGVRQSLSEQGPGMTLLPACPLMHGTGGFTALECLSEGGRVVLLASRQFDAIELLDTVEREKVNGLIIVGDAFAKPILAALEADPDRWDLTSLMGIISSGVMWSEETKQGLLRHHPNMLLVDAFSSSEALGMGSSVSSGASAAHTAQFTLGPFVRVLDPDGHDVVPGSDQPGVLALGGRIPLGYYKDEAKTAATFRTIDGARYSIPGDYAEVREDGSIHLLGRGSVVINTGGEKVFPEEVEEAIKTVDRVHDAVAVGIPNERFGEEIIAAVELAPGTPEGSVSEEAIIEHVKGQLASYKAPRRVRFVATIGRSPSGKVDYARIRAETAAWVGVEL